MTRTGTSHKFVGIDVSDDIELTIRLSLRADRETFHLAAVSTFGNGGGPNRPAIIHS